MSKKAQAGNLWVEPGAEDDYRYEIGGARKLCLPNWKFRSLMSAVQNLNDGISGFIVKEASTCWPMKTAFYIKPETQRIDSRARKYLRSQSLRTALAGNPCC